MVYLDSAATSLKPRPVVDAVAGYYTDVGASIHRGKHMLSEEASEDYEAARARVARFVGAQANHVVFTASTTHALNLVATGLDLSPDDVVLVSADAHHSLQLPLRARATVRWIPYDETGQVLRMSTYVYTSGADVATAFGALDDLYPLFAGPVAEPD